MAKNREKVTELSALKVKQWLADWNNVDWDPTQNRAEPKHWFYQFSIPATDLRALSGIYPRTSKRKRGADDLGIQRAHEESRSQEIAQFVRYGFPWSDLSQAKRDSGEFKELQKPGWLPTAIVVNILLPNDRRRKKKVADDDIISIKDGVNRIATVRLPSSYTGPSWEAKEIPPIEIIDGQHRLWAFDSENIESDFELPVVAFVGLDISWQAYLFYTINIKPRKINASLAFDLYPLLRTEDWLSKFEGHAIYRETRAQELVDLLWSCPESPWYHRINMLGEKGFKGVMATQAAWIRSFLAAYIKSWEGRGTKIGGLFGTLGGTHDTVLPWNRTEQAAFIVVLGQYLRQEVEASKKPWAVELRKSKDFSLLDDDHNLDLAFFGPNSLLNQDQGIRAFLHVTNDLCYVCSEELNLEGWGGRANLGTDDERVAEAAASLRRKPTIANFLKEMCAALATYDWRASSAPGLSEEESTLKASFRGSGGYKELRRHVLRHISSGRGDVANASATVIDALGY